MAARLFGYTLLFFCFHAAAGTVNWEGDESNDWNTPGNWDSGVPGAGDDVVITNTGADPVFSGTSTIQSLTLSSGTLTIANSSSLSLSAASSIASGASLETNGSGFISLGAMTLTSQGNINGTVLAGATSTLNLDGGANQTGTVLFAPNANGATLTSTGGVAVAPAGTLTFMPSTTGTITANLVGALEVQGTFNIVGTSSVDTRLDLNGGANLTISGELSFQASAGGEGGVVGTGTLTITSAGQMNVSGANDPVPLANSITNNAGQITVLSGTLQTSATLNNNAGTVDASAVGAQLSQTAAGVLVSTGDLVGTLTTSTGTVALNGDGTQLGPLTLHVNAPGFGLSGHAANAIPLNSTVTIEPTTTGTISFNITSDVGVAGTLNLNGNASVDTRMDINGGTLFTVSGTLNIGATAGGEGGLIGTGTLSIAAGGLVNVMGANDAVPLICPTLNAGTIEIDTGVLSLDTTVTSSGTLRAQMGAQFRQENGRTLTSTGDIAGVLFTGTGSVALNGNGTQAGPLRIAPNANNFTLNGHATNAVPAGSTLTIEPTTTGTITFNVGSDFGVAGTLNLNGNSSVDTRMDINNTFVFSLSGTLNIGASNGGEGGFLGAGTLSVLNGGLLNVAGANDSVPLNCATQNAGTIEVDTGVLSLDATVTSSGTLRALAGARFQQQNARSLTSTGDIAGELFTGTGSVALNGNGTQAGPLRIAPNANNFTLNGHATNAVPAGSTLTIEPTTTGTITFNVGSDFGVAGTLNLNGNSSVDTRMNINNAFVFSLSGTLNVGASNGGEGGFLGTGTLSILNGGLLNVAGANDFVPLSCATQNAGTIEVDTGVLFLNATVTSSGTLRALTGTRFQQENGQTLTSTGDIAGELFTGTGSVALNGNGTQTGPLRIAPNANGFTLSGHATNAVPAGSTLTIEPTATGTITFNVASDFGVAGTLNLNGNSSVDTVLDVNGGSTLEITGQMVIGSAAGGEGRLTGGGLFSILAAGTFTANGSNDAISISCTVQNAGTLRVTSGTLVQNSTFTNSGLMESTGSAQFVQTAGRTLTSTGNVRGRLVTDNGSVAFNGNGTQSGPLHLAPNANGFVLTSSAANTIPAGGALKIEPTTSGTIQFNLTSDFVVNGTLELNGNPSVDTQMNINGGNTLTIKGTLNMGAGGGGEGQFLGGGAFLLDTTGTVNVQGANDAVPFGSGAVTLNGTFRVASGLADIPSVTSATAVLAVAGGSTLRVGGGGGTATLSGSMSRAEGSGTLNGNLTAAGRLRPGLAGAAGTLTVTGALTLAGTAVLELELGGATPGTQFDVLAVGGAASLNGALKTSFIGGFVPAPNTNFTVMSYASRSGTFTLDTDDATLGTYFLSTANPTSLVLRAKTIPSAQGASLQTQQGLAITSTLSATDADGDALTFTLSAAPSKGGVTITNAATGAFIYTPDPDAVAFDTFSFQASDGQRSRTAAVAISIIPRDAPVVNTLTASRDSIKVGTPIDFSATATDPNALPLTLSWDFNDGGTASGTPVSHTYTAEGTFTVTLTASNGFNSGTSTVSIAVFAPNPGAEGVKNVSDGQPAITNPLDGLSVSVASSDGGVIELAIDTSGLRDEPSLSTSFEGLTSLFAVRSSRRPVQKFTDSGIFVATTVATDKTTGATLGKVRKTLAVSIRETKPALASSAEPSSKAIDAAALSGKFVFNSEKPDQIVFSGSIELPAGLDLAEPQEVAFSCGNVDDLLRFDTRGRLLKTDGSETGRVSKASIKFPRTDKGTTLTSSGQTAKFSATLKLAGLSAEGFDTEGITNRVREDETGTKGGVERSIQIALVLGGIAYETRAPVKFQLVSKGAGGKIKGRVAR